MKLYLLPYPIFIVYIFVFSASSLGIFLSFLFFLIPLRIYMYPFQEKQSIYKQSLYRILMDIWHIIYAF